MLKSATLAALIIITLGISTSYAKIWRVNNNTGITADFTTLQAAHNGASSGDTIHLESSPNRYGGLNCSKKLVIIGTGYLLGENSNSQALTQSAKVDGFNMYEGSEGSVIMGLDFSSNGINIYSNDLVIRRNSFANSANGVSDYYTGSITLHYLNNHHPTAASNIIISQNFDVKIDVNYPSTGLLITNNFIASNGYAGDASTERAVQLHANASAIIQNNIFRRGSVTINNSSLTNNIMYAGTFSGSANLLSNNIGSGTQFGTSNGNQSNVDMAAVFVGSGTGISTDARWKLKSGSPAIGAGYGSTASNPVDAGMFSGNTPYMLAGLPPVPAIYFFENQPVGSNNDPIDVTIKVKSVN